jgi:hypothetical protein
VVAGDVFEGEVLGAEVIAEGDERGAFEFLEAAILQRLVDVEVVTDEGRVGVFADEVDEAFGLRDEGLLPAVAAGFDEDDVGLGRVVRRGVDGFLNGFELRGFLG